MATIAPGLNPLFGGSAFRTELERGFNRSLVLIPFLAGLLFGHCMRYTVVVRRGLNPLFGGSAFRTRQF